MKNPTIFTLLKSGCTIEFKTGYKLTGDVENNDIDLSTPFGNDGFYCLTKEGLQSALKDAKNYKGD